MWDGEVLLLYTLAIDRTLLEEMRRTTGFYSLRAGPKGPWMSIGVWGK